MHNRKFVSLLILGLALFECLSGASLADAQSWVATGSMATSRRHATFTQLPNGKILVVGGVSTVGSDLNCNVALNCQFFASAELYDPLAGTFTATGTLTTGRALHTATLLQNGKVLIAGGFDPAIGSFSSAELYDPVTGSFTATGSMNSTRSQHTATLLANGKVLIAAGFGRAVGDEFGEASLATAEEYDPATSTFTSVGNLSQNRNTHTASRLFNGQVLVAGGFGSSGVLSSAELYDPVAQTFSTTGSLITARGSSHQATLLPDGKVLVSGGNNGAALSSAEKYDPATGTFSAAGNLNQARQWHASVLLLNGQVLIAGGNNNASGHWDIHTNYLASAEIYNPTTNTSSVTTSMVSVRSMAGSGLLSTGTVLVVGGGTNTAELFSPPGQVDSDSDGFADLVDNCPDHANSTQSDSDTDLLGDACDDKTHTATALGGTVAAGNPVLVTFQVATTGNESALLFKPDCVNIFQEVKDTTTGAVLPLQERMKPRIMPDQLVPAPGQTYFATCDIRDAVAPGSLVPGHSFTVTGYYANDVNSTDYPGIFRGVIKSNAVTFSVSSGTPAISVQMDIKFGTYPNSLNPEKKGVTPVTIFGSATFNVNQIDVTSLRLAGSPVSTKNKGGLDYDINDKNGDGFPDLTAQFETPPRSQFNLAPGQIDTLVTLTGQLLNNGPKFTAVDSVHITSQ